MGERRVGLIPSARTMVRSGNYETCGILVTDRRSIVLFELPSVKGFKAGIRDTFGLDPGEEHVPAVPLDPATADIDSLANVPGNIVIPHIAIKKFEFGKMMGGYGVTISYESDRGKDLGVIAYLHPPKRLLEARKREGVTAKDVRKQYAEKAAEVFKRALPPVIAAKGEWKL